jgi:hypothetical protein
VASVTFDFIDTAFVMDWGSVVSLSFRKVFYRVDASECYSCVCVFEYVSNFAYLWAVICEGRPTTCNKPTATSARNSHQKLLV